jgi:hypothetical protein
LIINKNNLDKSITKVDGKALTFKDNDGNVILKPLYDTHHERYVVYWDLKSK